MGSWNDREAGHLRNRHCHAGCVRGVRHQGVGAVTKPNWLIEACEIQDGVAVKAAQDAETASRSREEATIRYQGICLADEIHGNPKYSPSNKLVLISRALLYAEMELARHRQARKDEIEAREKMRRDMMIGTGIGQMGTG